MNLFHQKLTIPKLGHPSLGRPVFNSALTDAITAGKGVLLNAPAGWGKTMSLVAWINTQPIDMPVCWYSLDTGDRDPIIFLRYLLTLLSPHYPVLLKLLEQLHFDANVASINSFVDQAISTIASTRDPVLLILDDAHLLAGEGAQAIQPITRMVEGLIRTTSISVVLLSRVILHSMIQLIMQGHVYNIDSRALGFSAADAVALTALRYDRVLESDEAEHLVSWAERWPAAIVLALENWHWRGMRAKPTLEAVLPETSRSHLYYYLAEQVFNPLPAPLQQFLLETAVLDEMIPERCDALREAHNSAAFLTDLQNRDLSILTHDGWIRYYDLFRNFLLTRLQEQPERAHYLLRRSAELSQQWGAYNVAFERWLQVNDLDAAIELVLTVGPVLHQQGSYTTVQSWIDVLGKRQAIPPSLLLLKARIASDTADWNTAYAAIQVALRSNNPQVIMEARLLEVGIACIRREDERAREIMTTIQLEALTPSLRTKAYEMKGRIALNLGQAHDGLVWFKQALEIYDTTVPATATSTPPAHLYDLLGLAYAMNGDRDSGLYYLRQADSVWQMLNAPVRRVNTLNNLATLATEDGRLAEASQLLYEGLELANRYGRHRFQVLLTCGLAEVELLEGRFNEALNSYATAARIAHNAQLPAQYAYACAGALGAAVLAHSQQDVKHWRKEIDRLPAAGNVTHAGLIALACALAQEDLELALYHSAQVEEAKDLASHEHMKFLLLRTQLAYRCNGWHAAKPYWQAFEESAPGYHLHMLLQKQLELTPGLLSEVGNTPLAHCLGKPTVNEAQQFSFSALGQFAISCSGQAEPIAVRPLDQLVIIRLVEAGISGIPVLELWEDVWGDHLYSSGALRQSLNRIRRTTGLTIQMRQGHCQLLLAWASVTYDVERFESPLHIDPTTAGSAEIAALEQQLALYQGNFLCHLHHESEWLTQRRMILSRRALSMQERLAEIIERDNPHHALQLYNEILSQDGCFELAAAGAIRCATKLGDRRLAVSIYQHVCNELVLNLGTDPSPALEHLYRQVA